jgi:predicted metal-binding membrane protein
MMRHVSLLVLLWTTKLVQTTVIQRRRKFNPGLSRVQPNPKLPSHTFSVVCLAKRSASMTGIPLFLSSAVTVLLPHAMPPVKPMISMGCC